MGNASSELNPLFSADELNWKSGTLSDSVPAPIGNVTTYEGLKANTVFKDYLLKHVDSDYLASSIMTMGDGEIAFLKGIDKFKELEPEWIESFQGLVDNFQLCTAAGIEVSIICKMPITLFQCILIGQMVVSLSLYPPSVER